MSFAPLRYKLLEIEMDKNSKWNKGDFDAKMPLSPVAKKTLYGGSTIFETGSNV